MQKKRILIIGNYTPDGGGISQVINLQMKVFDQYLIDYTLFNTKKKPLERLVLFFKLPKQIKSFDLVHVHCCSGLGFYPLILTVISNLLNKRKICVSYHGGQASTFFKNHMFWVKLFFNKVDTIFVMSNFLVEIFNTYSLRTVLLKNPIEFELSNRKIFTNNQIHFLSLRSHEEIYNIELIVDAFKLLTLHYDNLFLSIVGKGSKSNEIKDKSLGFSNINFIGHVGREELKHLLNSTDVVVSVPSFDNQPMSILEGIATNNVIITSDVGGVRDLIPSDEFGVLVKPNNLEDLIFKMKKIVQNPHHYIHVADNAKKILENHSIDCFYKTLMKYYNR